MAARTTAASTRGSLTGAQVNLFCEDPKSASAFFVALGATEAFRFPRTGRAEHVEVDAAGLRIGLTDVEAAQRVAGVGAVAADRPASAEVVLWCDDTAALHERGLALGAHEIEAPRTSPDNRLRYSWLRTPQGHQLKVVQTLADG